jgi:hypothetical protein
MVAQYLSQLRHRATPNDSEEDNNHSAFQGSPSFSADFLQVPITEFFHELIS